jgi:hypothetical protein
MIIESKVAVDNSVILVMDGVDVEVPQSMGGGVIASTPTCIAIGTLAEMDGSPTIILTDEKYTGESSLNMRLAYAGKLLTPRKEITVFTVALQPLAHLAVVDVETNVEVWLDDEIEPERIVIHVKQVNPTGQPKHGEDQRAK